MARLAPSRARVRAATTRASVASLLSLVPLAAAFALGGAACSSSNDSKPATEPDAGPAGDDDNDEDSTPDAGASDARGSDQDAASNLPPPVETSYDVAKKYVGSYAGKITFRKKESLGTLGTLDALVTILATATITSDDAKQVVTLTPGYCNSKLTGEGTGLLKGSGVDTPDIVMTSTKLDPVPFSANVGDGGTVSWSVPEVHGPVGWTWTTSGDALPSDKADRRIGDQDNDGHPGVTINVVLSGNSTPVYAVQAQRETYGGTVDAKGTLVGAVADRSEQFVIDSPNPLLAAAQLDQQPDTITADNVVRFVKVPSAMSCADVVAKAATLFP